MENKKNQLKLRYVKYSPILTLPFYMEYQKKILHDYKYQNKISDIYGFINHNQNFIRFEEYSFDLKNINIKSGSAYFLKGLICHFSTFEEFLMCSNSEEINEKITHLFTDKNKLNANYDNLNRYSFLLLMFADLKNYVFHYNFLEINYPLNFKITNYSKYKKDIKNEEFLIEKIDNVSKENQNGFNLIEYLANYLNFDNEREYLSDIFFDGISDYDKMSSLQKTRIYFYLIENFITKNNLNKIEGNFPYELKNYLKSIQYLSLYLVKEDLNSSIIVKKRLKEENHSLEIYELKISEFEIGEFVKINFDNNRNIRVDLKNTFDPYTVCENSVDLNINLMKWRMAPDLNIEILRNTKFLLIGAGTLGCHVSRNLLGWGARYINFIDSGNISYSNPVRQSLYTFSDAKDGVNSKAETASKKLKEIFPSVNSDGFSFQIPLPGRKLIDEKSEETYFKKVEQLEKLIIDNDVIFLLTDSRESRWFPTVFSKKHNKICVTAAIGFDSFVVMRHGLNDKKLEGKIIGCYFCNDIVSPVDTSMNRTLDQQCTISRPGVSGICSGFAAELAISLIQEGNSVGTDIPEIIRGNIKDFNFLKMKLEASKNCIACSEHIITAITNDRENFLKNLMNKQDYLEDICGISDLMKDVNIDDVEFVECEDDF